MIELYSGTPGSGKSLHAAKTIKDWIHTKGKPVIGNFEFNARACKPRKHGSYLYVPNEKMHPDLLIYFYEDYVKTFDLDNVKEEEILLVIDECQLLFNSREWNKPDRKAWMSFFTQHRKLKYRIILIAQFMNMIDRQIRSVIEYEYLHRKLKNIGKSGFLMNVAAGGGLHLYVKMYVPLKLKVDSAFFKTDQRLYSLYDSYTRFDAEDTWTSPAANVEGASVASGSPRLAVGQDPDAPRRLKSIEELKKEWQT